LTVTTLNDGSSLTVSCDVVDGISWTVKLGGKLIGSGTRSWQKPPLACTLGRLASPRTAICFGGRVSQPKHETAASDFPRLGNRYPGNKDGILTIISWG
jgi:hypothetical protein